MSKVALQADVCYNGGRNIAVSRDAVNTSRLIHLVGDAPMNTLPPHAQESKTTFIYIHVDPVTRLVRYVGKADNPQKRLTYHLLCIQKNAHTEWIGSLKLQGLLPVQEIVEEVPYEQWQERERYWIAYYRERGMPLTNATSGGNGVSGYVRPAEVQSRITRAIRRGKARKGDSSVRVHSHPKQTVRRTSVRGKGVSLSREQRHNLQQKFLQSFALTNNILLSCETIGIDRTAFYYWLRADMQFRSQFEEQVSTTRRKGQRMDQAQRLGVQDAFLQSFSLTSNVRESAKVAGIDHSLVYYWLKNDEQFRIRYRQIEENYEPILDSSTAKKRRKGQEAAYE